MEALLAGFLRYGALVACGWIAAGMAMDVAGSEAARRCMAFGIVLLIALPVVRVALTAVVFLFEGDYVFAAISGAVFAIIVIGLLLGAGFYG